MTITTTNVERDIRLQYNKRIFFCIRIRGAALLIGLWDLILHSILLCTLIFMFHRPPRPLNDITYVNDPYPMMKQQNQGYAFDKDGRIFTEPVAQNSKLTSDNVLLNRILAARNMTRTKFTNPERTFDSGGDYMTVKWMASLNRKDKSIVFFVLISTIIVVLANIYGILSTKAVYIIPYFLVKIFNVIVSVLYLLSFYASISDIKLWLQTKSDIPLKQYLLELDVQTLQLVVFAFLLFVVLAKLYIASIIWYSYGYITALTMARTIGTVTDIDNAESFARDMYSPPKYDEAIKSNYQEQEYSPPPYTPLLHSPI